MPMLEKTYGADSDLKPAIFHISKATAEIRNAAGIIESYDFLDQKLLTDNTHMVL